MTRAYQVCSYCVMDTTEPGIRFDPEGVCNHCRDARGRMAAQLPDPARRDRELHALVEQIRREGRGRDYDCIIGVSGGVDSTLVAYTLRKLGLRPLAVHFDNGWDSELAVDNIHHTLQALDIELDTYVVDWDEFRDLQLAFLRAGVVNCEAPTDHAIAATLFRVALREKVRFILSGSNLVTESIMPVTWAYYNQDLRNLKAIHGRFALSPLATYPTISVLQYLDYVFLRKIRQIPFLNYVDYQKAAAKRLLEAEIGWRDYGGKHYESVWTRFYQGYYLPKKFNIDKRRAHLSTLICSGQMTRAAALEELRQPTYEAGLLKEDMQFVIKKFGLTREAFEAIIQAPARKHTDYPNNYFWFHQLKHLKNVFRAIATRP